jgi:hypothetical protein
MLSRLSVPFEKARFRIRERACSFDAALLPDARMTLVAIV